MHRFVLICVSCAVIFLGGCNFFRAPGKDSCAKIISKQKMVDLLSDIYLMEAFLQTEKMGSPHYEDTVMYYYAGLFQRHEISRETFREALSCYLLHEKEIQDIHEEIMQRYSMLESELAFSAAEKIIPANDYPWWHTAAGFSIPYIQGGKHAFDKKDSVLTDTADEEAAHTTPD